VRSTFTSSEAAVVDSLVAVTSCPQRGWQLTVERPAPDLVRVRLSGTWRLEHHLPDVAEIQDALARNPSVRRLTLEASEVTAWDTGLVAFVLKTMRLCESKAIVVDRQTLPAGVDRLIGLATAVPEKKMAPPQAGRPWLARVGLASIAIWDSVRGFMTFVGEAVLAGGRLLRGNASFRRADLFEVVEACGPRALPIVTLISFLVGLILAFMGAVQLRSFGASIYVADLVAIAATREMGCLMTGIIMAGRTGAAFAAQLGTMRVNDEIDALVTMGIAPMEFLVLPRMLALVLMMPLLTVYSDLLAILGGAFVGVSMLGLGLVEYFNRTAEALTLTNFFVGVFKGSVFGVLVALSGCLRGMQSGRSAAAVGLAATSAVVTAIVLIVVAEGIFAVVLNALKL
jgi:phospholipid/cholesterol/gamma-HCH transport system permease protein